MTLPEKHKEDWFVSRRNEGINPGMALYDTENDTFFSVYEVNNFTTYLRNLESGEIVAKGTTDIQKMLFEFWIPVRAKA